MQRRVLMAEPRRRLASFSRHGFRDATYVLAREMKHLSRHIGQTLSALLWLGVAHPLWRRQASSDTPWVIGGHRGRDYLDNSAALESWARAQGQAVIWIANDELYPRLEQMGVRTLRRHSWAARRAISQASALVYSHGEDDLDLFAILLRGRSAPRFYLNHCLNLLKAGGVLEPGWDEQGWLKKRVKRWLITDCDHLLCASELEGQNFARSYPMHASKLVLGGGAHLDGWATALKEAPKKRIYWFPTFRDTAQAQAKVIEMIEAVTGSKRLRQWLVDSGYEFFVGVHINAAAALSSQALEAPFKLADRSRLVEEIAQSELLISDYSGIVFDFLLSERPQVLFAFDRDEYLSGRCIYQDYDSLDFALHPQTSDELVEMLTTEQWRTPELSAAATRWRRQALPDRDKGFAESTLRQIQTLLSTEEVAP